MYVLNSRLSVSYEHDTHYEYAATSKSSQLRNDRNKAAEIQKIKKD